MDDDVVSHVWDIIVIGSGVGGGTIGRSLAESGLSVLFLEKGTAGYRREETPLDTIFLDDPEQRDRLGEAARTWVVEERDWHKITSRVDGVYRGLLGQSSTEA